MDSGIPSVTRREYIPVGSDAASMLHTVTEGIPDSILKVVCKRIIKNAISHLMGVFFTNYNVEKLQRFEEFNQIITLCYSRCAISRLTCCRFTAVPQNRFVDIACATIV